MANSVPPQIRLKRFLYTSLEQPKYVAGSPDVYHSYLPEKLESVANILKSEDPDKALNIICIVNSENLLPRRETLLFALSVAVLSEAAPSNNFRHLAYQTVLQVVKNDEEFFTFIQFCTKQRRTFSSGLNKLIGSYYLTKDPYQLVKHITTANGYHGWTHKDLIKLSHCKTLDMEMNAVLAYILFGIQKCKEVAPETVSTAQIIAHLDKFEEFKKSDDERRVAELLKELQLPVNKIPSKFYKSAVVWEAAASTMTIPQLIHYLPKLYKLGLLKPDTPVYLKVLTILSDVALIKDSQVHPVEVFVALKNFEKGGKAKDPKLLNYLELKQNDEHAEETEPDCKKTDFKLKCPAITSALHKTLRVSYLNPEATGKRFMIGIDVSSRMSDKCLHNRNITALEAAAIITLSLVKVENQVDVYVFNAKSVKQVLIEKETSVGQLMKKLTEAQIEEYLPSSLFDLATSTKKQIDVFVLLNHHLSLPKETKHKDRPLQCLAKYQSQMAAPHTKLITISFGVHNLHLADGQANALDICGFDIGVPKIVEAFSRGMF